MNVDIEQEQGITIVRLSGELDRQTVPELQDRLLPLIVPGCKILMDMSNVTYMSSAGLRVFLLFYRRVDGENGRIVLSGLQEMLYDTMSITGFLDFFQTYDTAAAGIAALKQSRS
ncbi:MAG: anti-sigma factor antagonist [Ardenticatenaceae bacterium]|nr:anti-sigma factor antagonist [Ardenticatenaceae bacterium]